MLRCAVLLHLRQTSYRGLAFELAIRSRRPAVRAVGPVAGGAGQVGVAGGHRFIGAGTLGADRAGFAGGGAHGGRGDGRDGAGGQHGDRDAHPGAVRQRLVVRRGAGVDAAVDAQEAGTEGGGVPRSSPGGEAAGRWRSVRGAAPNAAPRSYRKLLRVVRPHTALHGLGAAGGASRWNRNGAGRGRRRDDGVSWSCWTGWWIRPNGGCRGRDGAGGREGAEFVRAAHGHHPARAGARRNTGTRSTWPRGVADWCSTWWWSKAIRPTAPDVCRCCSGMSSTTAPRRRGRRSTAGRLAQEPDRGQAVGRRPSGVSQENAGSSPRHDAVGRGCTAG